METLSLRPITPEDREFLYQVFASTHEGEMALLAWDEVQKNEFLRVQFNAQHTYYLGQFTEAAFEVVLLDGEPVGRLYVDRRQDEIRIIDIALLAEHRKKGIGSKLLSEILAEASQARLPVRIHVEQYNPALRLYERLGFSPTNHIGMYYLMEWRPERIHA
ncbi:MAG: GNAT family N-acetyltransferase [Anaerolineales bacterium]|nr:GNAT family N-acetyltransferase [Anaerolineales bacterium]